MTYNENENIPEITAEILNQAFDTTSIKFHDRAAALAAFKENHEIALDAEGNAITTYDGEPNLSLADALSRWAYDNRGAVDQRTLPKLGLGSQRPGTASKQDYQTVSEKAAFIKQHGFDAWESLPLKPVDTSEVTSFEQFTRLTLKEKSRLIAADKDIVSKLAAKSTHRLNGAAYINHEAMAKLKAINPNKR